MRSIQTRILLGVVCGIIALVIGFSVFSRYKPDQLQKINTSELVPEYLSLGTDTTSWKVRISLLTGKVDIAKGTNLDAGSKMFWLMVEHFFETENKHLRRQLNSCLGTTGYRLDAPLPQASGE